MNKILLLIISFIVFSCASVEKKKINEEFKTSEKTKEESKELNEIRSSSDSRSESNSKIENVNFSIVPEIGKFADFTFNYNGKLISGSTSGILNFSNQKSETKVNTFTKTYFILKKYSYRYKYFEKQIVYRITTKYKNTTFDYPWYFWVIIASSIVIIWELLKRFIPGWIKIILQQLNRKR